MVPLQYRSTRGPAGTGMSWEQPFRARPSDMGDHMTRAEPSIHSRLLVSVAAVCLVTGPALADIRNPAPAPSLPKADSLASQERSGPTSPNGAHDASNPIRVAASDLEAFGIVIPEVVPPGDTDDLSRILADYRSGTSRKPISSSRS